MSDSSDSGRNWMELIAATAVGAAVSFVVTRELSRRLDEKKGHTHSASELTDNPEERLLKMLEAMDE